MNHKVRLSTFLHLVVLLLFSGCQVATPLTPIVQVITETPQPTLLPSSTATPKPTITPAPLCGTVVLPNTTSQVTDETQILAKFEPPDNQSYFGFSYRIWDDEPISQNVRWGDTRPFAERICDSIQIELGGKTPTLMVVYGDFISPFSKVLGDISQIRAVLGSSVIPMLSWEADVSNTTKDISSGKYDDFIMRYAKDVKAYGKPLFIGLICSGFNGNFHPGCSPVRGGEKLTSEDFVNAWQRVVDIFRKEGVTNVAWVWEPAVPSPADAEAGDWGWNIHWTAFYPGDDYVDWVGALQGGWGQSNWLNPIYQFGVEHHKPLLVQFGIRHRLSNLSSRQWMNWLGAMLDYFESRPQIKAIIYDNQTTIQDIDSSTSSTDLVFLYDGKVSYRPDVNDFDQRLLTGGDEMRALFASHIMDSRYISVLVVKP